MRSTRSLIIASAAAVLLGAALSSAGEAQRRQSTPPDLEATFEPLETRVEEVRGGTRITFGDRSYTIETLADGRRTISGSLLGLRDEGRQQRWRQQGKWYVEADHLINILPGFGLARAPATGYTRSDGGRYVDLLRARDGVIDPPIPGVTAGLESGAAWLFTHSQEPGGLIADRTLFITGGRSLYRHSGTVADGDHRATPLERTVSFAWLFDDSGLVQAWTPLADLSGATGASNAGIDRLRYVRRSADGHVMFATPGIDGTLDVHLMDPDLEAVQTFTGVRRLKQQTESPTDQHLPRDVGGTRFEAWTLNPSHLDTVLLAPIGRHGWYGVLHEHGLERLPDGAVGLQPLTRTRTSDAYPPGVTPVQYEMASGYLVLYETPEGSRYGWASPQLSTFTGPIWRQAQIVESARLSSEAPGFIDPELIVAQSDAGYWRAYAEPRIEYALATLTAPNTFSGLIPPASDAEDALRLAEAALIYFRNEAGRARSARTESALAAYREDRQQAARERMLRMAEREQAWRAAFEGLAIGLSQMDTGAYTPRTRPSALGPDFYWDGDELYHRPSGRRVD